jgi:hypothetical protein
VGGVSSYDKHLEAIYRESLHVYEASLNFTYLTDLDMPTLLERLRHLPAHTIVLYTHIGMDAKGTRFVGASQADPVVAMAANAPVFGPSDVDLGHGEVGGYRNIFARTMGRSSSPKTYGTGWPTQEQKRCTSNPVRLGRTAIARASTPNSGTSSSMGRSSTR